MSNRTDEFPRLSEATPMIQVCHDVKHRKRTSECQEIIICTPKASPLNETTTIKQGQEKDYGRPYEPQPESWPKKKASCVI